MDIDSEVGVDWLIDYLKADVSGLIPLLTGTGVYSDSIPRNVDLTVKPAIIVSLQSTKPPWNPMNRGRQTNIYTSSTVQTKVVMQSASYSLIRPVVRRLVELLDGKVFQVSTTGIVYSCVKGQDARFETIEGNIQFKNRLVLWEMNTKAN